MITNSNRRLTLTFYPMKTSSPIVNGASSRIVIFDLTFLPTSPPSTVLRIPQKNLQTSGSYFSAGKPLPSPSPANRATGNSSPSRAVQGPRRDFRQQS